MAWRENYSICIVNNRSGFRGEIKRWEKLREAKNDSVTKKFCSVFSFSDQLLLVTWGQMIQNPVVFLKQHLHAKHWTSVEKGNQKLADWETNSLCPQFHYNGFLKLAILSLLSWKIIFLHFSWAFKVPLFQIHALHKEQNNLAVTQKSKAVIEKKQE